MIKVWLVMLSIKSILESLGNICYEANVTDLDMHVTP